MIKMINQKMMNRKTIIFIFILAALAGLLLGLKLFLLKQETPLGVVLVFPENLATDVSVSGKIKIDFNRSLLAENEVIATLSPQITFTAALENNDQTLTLSPQGPFSSGTEYTLVLATQGQSFWQSKFTTQKLQGDPRIPYESEQFTKLNYPLLEFIPYETDKFSVTYAGPLTLAVTIRTGSQETIAPIVLEWIKSHGVDPVTHKISWLTPEL